MFVPACEWHMRLDRKMNCAAFDKIPLMDLLRKVSVPISIALVAMAASGCIRTKLSQPASFGTATENLPVPHLIPSGDMSFTLERGAGDLTVVITAKGWKIEGFGTTERPGRDGGRELIISAVGGKRIAGSDRCSHTVSCAPHTAFDVFYEDRLGKRRKIQENHEPAASDRDRPLL